MSPRMPPRHPRRGWAARTDGLAREYPPRPDAADACVPVHQLPRIIITYVTTRSIQWAARGDACRPASGSPEKNSID